MSSRASARSSSRSSGWLTGYTFSATSRSCTRSIACSTDARRPSLTVRSTSYRRPALRAQPSSLRLRRIVVLEVGDGHHAPLHRLVGQQRPVGCVARLVDGELVVEVGEVGLHRVLADEQPAAISRTDAGGWNMLWDRSGRHSSTSTRRSIRVRLVGGGSIASVAGRRVRTIAEHQAAVGRRSSSSPSWSRRWPVSRSPLSAGAVPRAQVADEPGRAHLLEHGVAPGTRSGPRARCPPMPRPNRWCRRRPRA